MNRNVESHFAQQPQVDIQRSMFDRSAGHKTSFNVGQLIPFFVDEVLPGDTFNVSTSIVARLQTLLTPVMDNIYIDTYYFFVPNRIVWSHWKEFMGESDQAWLPSTEYTVPRLYPPECDYQFTDIYDDNKKYSTYHWIPHTIADYFGLPVTDDGVDVSFNTPVNALPFRAYAAIANEFFRDQNLQDPIQIPLDDQWYNGSNGNNQVTDIAYGGAPFIAAKYHDYFTSCLPAAQKAEQFSIFQLASDKFAPVDTGKMRTVDKYPQPFGFNPILGYGASTSLPNTLDPVRPNVGSESTTGSYAFTVRTGNVTEFYENGFQPTNLWADVSGAMMTINELRLAFQMQKYYEKCARGGTRYREILKEHFGVTSPDARMMIPEYLGGHRFPLAIHQIANQSQGESDFLGDLGALSNTSDINSDFVKSFTEHGFVIGVMVARYDHSYSQGVERFWLRGNDKLDYYWPVFANLGEQPVYKSEIFAYKTPHVGEASEDFNLPVEGAFGFNEAWADYRFKPSRVSGDMRPDVANTLASWHLGDDYKTMPQLSATWIQEDYANVDRVLAVTSSAANQIFCDIYVKNICTRPMPMYSIPGLADHH